MGIVGSYMSIEENLFEQAIRGGGETIGVERFQQLDLDKSWEMIHFLLCRCKENGEPPMGYVVPMRDENELDFGEATDGRVFYITAQQVREADDYLNSLSDDALREMFDFKEMQKNGVYPLYGKEDASEIYDYIYFFLTKIREFYHQAAEKGHAISLLIC